MQPVNQFTFGDKGIAAMWPHTSDGRWLEMVMQTSIRRLIIVLAVIGMVVLSVGMSAPEVSL